MHWIKNILIDLLATLVIALVVFFDTGEVLKYVLYIYTGLMVLARSITLISKNFRVITRKKVTDAPLWIYHLLYFLNTSMLAFGEFYITAAFWVFIWGVAYYVYVKQL
jgi:hypothetical protein